MHPIDDHNQIIQHMAGSKAPILANLDLCAQYISANKAFFQAAPERPANVQASAGLEYDYWVDRYQPLYFHAVSSDVGVFKLRGILGWSSSLSDFDDELAKIQSSSIKTLILKVDSPGGDQGLSEAMLAGFEQLKTKNKIKLIGSMGEYAASAGYKVLLPCSRIYASRATTTGSIGALMTRYDYSEALAKQGIQVLMTASGSEKLFGREELKITQAEKDKMKQKVDKGGLSFAQEVAKYRKLPLEQIVDLKAGIFNASEALEIGLIDGIMEYNDLLNKYGTQNAVAENNEPEVSNNIDIFGKLTQQSVNLNHIDPNQDDQMDEKVLNQIQALSEQVGALKAEVGALKSSNTELQAQNDKAKAVFAESAMLGIQQATGAAVTPEKEAELKSKSLSLVIEESKLWQTAAKNQIGNSSTGAVSHIAGLEKPSASLSTEKVDPAIANQISALFAQSKYATK